MTKEVFDIEGVEPDPVALEHFHADDATETHGEDEKSLTVSSEEPQRRLFGLLGPLTTSISSTKFVAALKAEGVAVVPVTKSGVSWVNHHRPVSLGAFDPHGILDHHTGPWSTVSGMVSLLWNGRSDLPGPLAQIGLAPDGKAYLVGWGRANHAGKGDADTYKALLNETGVIPKPNSDTVDGNSVLYGIEVIDKGSAQIPDIQLEALVKCNAAICRAHGWTANSVAHHKEWTYRKVDMAWHGVYAGRDMRALVKACLAMPPGVWKLHPVIPPPPLTTVTVFKFEGLVDRWWLPIGEVFEMVTTERANKWKASNIAVKRVTIPATDPRFKVKRITYP